METAAGATQRKIHYKFSGSGAIVPTLAGHGSYPVTANQTAYIDVFKDASLVNSRLYRQGRVPMVRFGFTGPPGDLYTAASVGVQTLPNTWTVRKAHQLALREYLRATKEERRRSGQARWHDFKVYYEDGHRTGTTLSPLDITTGNSEWDYSAIDDTGGTTRRFKFIGATDSNCYGMIASYDNMADQDDDSPDNPGTAMPYASLHPDVQVDNQDFLLDEGDAPPYNPDALQVQQRLEFVAVGSGKSDQLVSPWFPAPCGLLKVTGLAVASASIADDPLGMFFVEVAAGDYKGIHATPMGLKL